MQASSADLYNQISQYAPGDDLPCADASLIVPLKKSPEYRVIRPRVASPMAVDSWQDQGVHFFVFQLNPTEGVAVVPGDPPVVVFAMHPEQPAPVSAVVVTPKLGGEEAEVVDLRQDGNPYIAPLQAASASGSAPDSIPEHTDDTKTANGQVPDPNLDLLSAIKASPEFHSIESRLIQSLPAESWQEDDAHFFAFPLLPADGSAPNGHEPPVAVFAMRPPKHEPISAVVVTPHPDGEEADISDLRQPGS